MPVLSVNLNKVALLRNARGGVVPNVLDAARTVLGAGAEGITVHPRPDQRHIRPDDVLDLAQYLGSQHSDEALEAIELNVEGNPFAGARPNGYPGFDALIEQARPAQATLVPDGDNQLTSDHGFDLRGDQSALQDKIHRYQRAGARVSLFMDPDIGQISRARDLGVERIELFTGPFADAVTEYGAESGQARTLRDQFQQAAEHAVSVGLGVNAGHDLDLPNLPLFCTIPGLLELSIGHALIARALERGLTQTVKDFLVAINGADSGQRRKPGVTA
ncbi:MAG: pyridoxine 5'-phosphate synthase [Pseudomonadota bacterium]